MTKLPKTLFGKQVEGSLERVLSSEASPSVNPSNQQIPLTARANINPSDYIKIPGTNVLIQSYQSNNNLKWEETHFKLNEDGLFMPTPYLMMQHLVNVINAVQGKSTLYDATGNPISSDETRELYQYLTKDGHGSGVWTWLDSKFVKVPSGVSSKLELGLETDHRVILNGTKKELQGKLSSLQRYLEKDSYVELEFNAQGFPVKKATIKEYHQGSNIYFYHPRENSVAGFGANSDWAILSCIWDPAFSNSGLGVLACAEGTQKKI